jgi:hypothetical protein
MLYYFYRKNDNYKSGGIYTEYNFALRLLFEMFFIEFLIGVLLFSLLLGFDFNEISQENVFFRNGRFRFWALVFQKTYFGLERGRN